MISIRKSLIYFLIFVVVASFVVLKITDRAYGDAYTYSQYDYATGKTDVYTPEPAR